MIIANQIFTMPSTKSRAAIVSKGGKSNYQVCYKEDWPSRTWYLIVLLTRVCIGAYGAKWVLFIMWNGLCQYVHVVEQQLKSRVGMIVDSATATNKLNPLEQSECFYGNV